MGNTITSSSASITLTIGTNPGGGTLSCTTNPVVATAGVSTFAGCAITLTGTGYTLTATSAGLTSATSSTFNITVGAASKVAFTTQPGGGTGGTTWGTQPVVKVQDAGGNTVTSSSASITLAIGTNAGGGTLSCTANPKSATSGVDTFAGCKITLSGTGYTLTATSAGLTSATSGTFNITVGAASKLAFTTQPGGGTGGTAWGTQPVVDGAGRGWEHGDVVEREHHVGDRHEPGWRHVVVHDEPARGDVGRLHVRGLCDHTFGDRLHVDRGRDRV